MDSSRANHEKITSKTSRSTAISPTVWEYNGNDIWIWGFSMGQWECHLTGYFTWFHHVDFTNVITDGLVSIEQTEEWKCSLPCLPWSTITPITPAGMSATMNLSDFVDVYHKRRVSWTTKIETNNSFLEILNLPDLKIGKPQLNEENPRKRWVFYGFPRCSWEKPIISMVWIKKKYRVLTNNHVWGWIDLQQMNNMCPLWAIILVIPSGYVKIAIENDHW